LRSRGSDFLLVRFLICNRIFKTPKRY
jgi:hypothetical protein